MPHPDRTPAQYRAQFLMRELERAHLDSNAALRALAEAVTPAQRCANDPALRYRTGGAPGGAPRAITAAEFYRQYALCLQSLELSIRGYCVERQFGWERKREAVFSTRPPAWWRRLLRPTPMLVLRITADAGTVRIGFEACRGATAPRKSHHYLVRLEPAMQAELAHLHRRQAAARRSLPARLLAWCCRPRRHNATPPETDM